MTVSILLDEAAARHFTFSVNPQYLTFLRSDFAGMVQAQTVFGLHQQRLGRSVEQETIVAEDRKRVISFDKPNAVLPVQYRKYK